MDQFTEEDLFLLPVILIYMFVCQQDYAKNTEWIFKTFKKYGTNAFDFGLDPDKGTDPGRLSHFL